MPGLQRLRDCSRPSRQNVCVFVMRTHRWSHCCLAGGLGEGSVSLAFSTAGGVANAAVGACCSKGRTKALHAFPEHGSQCPD